VEEGRVATATILVCDLVGSTAQRASLGDDSADALAVVLDEILRQAVAHHYGSVVKGTGDGLQAIFDGLEARLAAGRTLTARGRPNTQTGSSTPADAQTSGDGS